MSKEKIYWHVTSKFFTLPPRILCTTKYCELKKIYLTKMISSQQHVWCGASRDQKILCTILERAISISSSYIYHIYPLMLQLWNITKQYMLKTTDIATFCYRHHSSLLLKMSHEQNHWLWFNLTYCPSSTISLIIICCTICHNMS